MFHPTEAIERLSFFILQRKEYDNEENIQYYYWSATNNGVGLHICNQSYTDFASA
ncbi:hypothetical protein [Faecalibacillus intestinalis]|uniref:hypothetical protein n=1 Tax=Faecalibacillus intestinalis TaxID=1982626 RepID=UPI00210C6E7E|nr:hypothetical protein [Faecalibacillus intestinalis]MCB7555360.1 hypothetical protein [bacterium TM223]MCQ4768384.1 hypothetical protein [Faecalibacillus intestinalis]